MTRKYCTVALHNLPPDIEKGQIINKLDRIAVEKSCRVSLGPLVNIYDAGRNHVVSRSTTVALQGSKWENVVSTLEGLHIASNSSQQAARVDREFFGITSLAEIEGSTIEYKYSLSELIDSFGHQLTGYSIDSIYNIHGLGGHAFESWACDIEGKNPATIKAWPRDFLPQEFKKHGLKARFATIGYNANVVGNVDVTGTIRSAAENLLSQLIAERPERSAASKRPMYFICHSLGGLVLCEALILLLSGREEFEHLASAYQYLFVHDGQCLLKGITFLGTPFQGSAKADQISPFVTALAAINPFPTNPKIVNELKNVPDGSSRLDDISDLANIIMERHGIEVLVACETQPVSGTGRSPITERNSALGVFKGRTIPITMHADHTHMVKFKNETSDYEVLSRRIIQMITQIDPANDYHSDPMPFINRAHTVPVGASGNQTIIHIHTDRHGYQWDAKDIVDFSNNSGRQGEGSRGAHNWSSGSPGLLPEQSNNHFPNQKRQDPVQVPPNIERLHIRSDPIVPTQNLLDSTEYSRLSMFDTVFIIDDTLSMGTPVDSNSTGHHQVIRWEMLERSLECVINIATAHDKDGVDIQFLKNPEQNGKNITDPDVFLGKLSVVRGLIQNSSPGTEFFDDLLDAISPRLDKFRVWKAAMAEGKRIKMPKPLNLIVVTDGRADDDDIVTWYLTEVAGQLDKLRAPPRQIGIQFVQIGDDPKATEWLRKLDDDLANGKVRDMIDTTPFDDQSGSDAGRESFKVLPKTTLRKMLLGGVTGDVDDQDNPPPLGAHVITPVASTNLGRIN